VGTMTRMSAGGGHRYVLPRGYTMRVLISLQTGMAVRYAIVAILFFAILAFFVGGYYHAQSRIRKGLPPLPYHRWMVRRSYYYPPQPRYMYPPEPPRHSYNMDGYPPPPPAYNNAEAPPPVYQPPAGATKALADQSFGQTNRAGEGSASTGVAVPAPTSSAQH
jgi:hypothetical protein